MGDMMETVLVRYGELFLKSESVKRHYIRILLENIRKALKTNLLEAAIEVHRGRILLEGEEPEQIAGVISRIFGVVGVSVCTRTPPDRTAIEDGAAKQATKHLKPGMSFAVRARRSGLKGFTSQELGASTGAKIIDAIPELKVDLKNPDYEIFIEARDFGGLIYDERIDGPGGLPLGTQGQVLSLLSAGIDSPVASWLMMRRGSNVTHLHFAGGSWMGKDVWNGACENHRIISTWCPGRPLLMIVADLEPLFEALVNITHIRNRCIICKRFMLRIAEELAEQHDMMGLVTGDTIGQVASQTMANMGVIESVLVSRLPIIRPLITYDKQETILLARYIGTFRDFAGDLDCMAVPKHPAIAASLEMIREDEEKLDIKNLQNKVLSSIRYYRAINGEIEEISSP
jgi:thiamine biosynthesis protein ThiI